MGMSHCLLYFWKKDTFNRMPYFIFVYLIYILLSSYCFMSPFVTVLYLFALTMIRNPKSERQGSWDHLVKTLNYWRRNYRKRRAAERGQRESYLNYMNSRWVWRSWRMNCHLGSWWSKKFLVCHVPRIYLLNLQLCKSEYIYFTTVGFITGTTSSQSPGTNSIPYTWKTCFFPVILFLYILLCLF